MEIIVELLFALLQFIAELALQLLFEVLAELGLHSIRAAVRPSGSSHPLLAALGYAILGAIVGGISLLVFPSNFISVAWLRVVNLVAAPLVAGAAMAGLGAWRKRRAQEPVLLDRFAYGFLFAVSMALVRFMWAH